MTEFKGCLNIKPEWRIAIAISRFNEFITKSLLEGALDSLERLGLNKKSIDVVWVPGAFELPLAAKTMINNQCYDAIICLGAVIRGDTPHFDYVCNSMSSGIAALSLEMNLPIIFGVLTTDTVEQALERSGIKGGNKGSEAAFAAVEMLNLLQDIREKPVSFHEALNHLNSTIPKVS